MTTYLIGLIKNDAFLIYTNNQSLASADNEGQFLLTILCVCVWEKHRQNNQITTKFRLTVLALVVKKCINI